MFYSYSNGNFHCYAGPVAAASTTPLQFCRAKDKCIVTQVKEATPSYPFTIDANSRVTLPGESPSYSNGNLHSYPRLVARHVTNFTGDTTTILPWEGQVIFTSEDATSRSTQSPSMPILDWQVPFLLQRQPPLLCRTCCKTSKGWNRRYNCNSVTSLKRKWSSHEQRRDTNPPIHPRY